MTSPSELVPGGWVLTVSGRDVLNEMLNDLEITLQP
jgi:hypothetical protein